MGDPDFGGWLGEPVRVNVMMRVLGALGLHIFASFRLASFGDTSVT